MRIGRFVAAAAIGAACLLALFPDFFSPNPPTRQDRDFPYARPGVYNGGSIQWLAHGDSYRWLGVVPASIRLVRTPPPGRIYLLGTDEFGRDWFARLCHGASISLLAAPAAALVSLTLAVMLGAWAGFRRGIVDLVVMRIGEVFLVVPWFYVVIALRAALPLTVSGPATLAIVFGLLALLGCAAPTRIFRGLVLSLRSREFVLAARGSGAAGGWIFRRHLLPFLLPVFWTQFLLTVPAFIVTEVTLSFLGLGVAEPFPTWGGMLVPLQQYSVATSYPWMFAPAIAIAGVCLALHVLAQHEALKV